MIIQRNSLDGYVALSSLLVVLVVVIVIGTATTLIAIDGGQAALGVYKESESMDIVDSCVSEVLLKINKQDLVPSTVTLPSGSCTIVTNSQVGSTYTFTATNQDGNYPKSIQVVADRNTTVTMTQWLEQ